jgi:glyoxylase-like metal-dependent hydrolase (beta-lactamase superfamily II)
MTAIRVDVAPGVMRLGDELVNFYLLEDGSALTLVDAGLPAHRQRLEAVLRHAGHALGDIEAVVLTHAHIDHVGIADGVRRDAGVRVHVSEGDAEMARTGKPHKRDGSLLPYMRHPAAWKLFAKFARSGAARPPKIGEVTTFESAAGHELDVPGRPRVIPTPGHSPGHVSFHLPQHGVVIAGDALCTYNPLIGARGPQLLPRAFAHSASQALASLDALEGLGADTVVFGHGEPFAEGIAAAVARARETGIT